MATSSTLKPGDLLSVDIDPSIHFRFPIATPQPAWIRVSSGVELLHPLLMPTDEAGPYANLDIRLPDDTVYCSRRRVVLRVQSEASFETVRARFFLYLRCVRYLSRQAELSVQVIAWGGFSDEQIRESGEVLEELEAMEAQDGIFFNRRFFDAPVQIDHLTSAAGVAEVPVSADVLLDAIEALRREDFRKAILYAAIAAEACANEALEQALKRVIQEKKDKHRVFSRPEAGGATTDIDAIANLLDEKGRYRQALHERSLYLLGKSMRFDQERLYKEAVELSKTRNKIAHGKRVERKGENKDAFELSSSDAERAIGCARRVIAWFGVDDTYPAETGHVREDGSQPDWER